MFNIWHYIKPQRKPLVCRKCGKLMIEHFSYINGCKAKQGGFKLNKRNPKRKA